LASGDFHSLAVADADTTAPETTITLQPPTNSNSSSATLEFSSSELESTFECRLDSVPFSSCTSPKTYVGLSEEQHTFEVRARDVAGNLDSTPASHTWTVDATAPSAPTIDLDADSDTGGSSTDNITKDDTPTFSGTAEANSTVELFEQLSGGTEQFTATVLADTSGNWSKELSGVTEDTHTYIARAKDTFGNSSGPSNAVAVTVDKTAPTLDTNNVNSVEPDSGAPAAPRLTNVWATFSESEGMDPATLEDPSTTFTLVRVNRNGSTKPVPATVSCVEDPCQTAKLDPFPSKPKTKLGSRKVYKVTITTAAKDLAGNALDGEKSWTFKTGRR
jgi:hypothetical protein